VVAEEPANHQARMLLGLAGYQLGELAEAVVHLELVRKAEPANVTAASTLALSYIGLRQFGKAEPLIDKVFRPLKTAEARLVVGSFYLATREYPKAIEELKQAVALNPRVPTVHATLGNAYVAAHDRQQAAKEFKAELDLNPHDFVAKVNLGWLLREEGRLDEAEALLRKALEQRPDDPAPLYQMAQLVQARGRNEEAAGLLEAVVRAEPGFIAARVLLARLYSKLNRTADFERERAVIESLQAQEQKHYQEQQNQPAQQTRRPATTTPPEL
jgi:tetratricopeptide (TPR) repeat protein